MIGKQKMEKMARARVSEKTWMKIRVYAQKHNCKDSDVVREALKVFLRYVSTKQLENPSEK